jgi:hypothetical protein
MPTNHYFNNYQAKYNEQRLVEDICVETIKIMGFEAFYLPNNNDQARDLIYGEDPVKKFQSSFPIELYLSNALEYLGDKEFFSKFGLEIKNNVNVILSKRTFSERVPQNTFTRPREGDLIYIPFLNGTGELYEIKFTNQTKDFFMLGRQVPYFYELEMEKFKFSQEIIGTGNPDIDSIAGQSAYTLTLNLGTGTGSYLQKEIVFQSPDQTLGNATTIAIVSSFSSVANTLTLTNIAGEFVDGRVIIGSTSNAQFVLSSYDPMYEPSQREVYTNQVIEQLTNPIIDTSETNPMTGL